MVSVALLLVILTMVVVVIDTVHSPARDAMHRIMVVATADQVVGGVGEAQARFRFTLVSNQDSNTFAYEALAPDSSKGVSDITALIIRGPTPNGLETGPVAGALCGFPGDACDVISTPGRTAGTLTNVIKDGIHPAGVDIRPLAEAIRANGLRYYIEVRTNAVPAAPGAARAELNVFGGFE